MLGAVRKPPEDQGGSDPPDVDQRIAALEEHDGATGMPDWAAYTVALVTLVIIVIFLIW
jgi:hypothetical protein